MPVLRFSLLLSLLLAHGAAAIADDALKSLARGLEYRHEIRADGPLSIHVLSIDRRQPWELHTALGQGTVFGLEPLRALSPAPPNG